MTDTDRISGLESALMERAQKLAAEHHSNARHARERILAETGQRLRIEEEREVLAAKALAERAYQQRVQAAELELRAGLDRLRWELVNGVLDNLPARLEQLAADEQRYLPWLQVCLYEGGQAIERDELVVQVNARDLQRLQKDWNKYAQQAVPGKRLALSPEPLNIRGGVLVSSADGDIRYDNTFEGRRERLGEALQGVIAERLLAQSGEMKNG